MILGSLFRPSLLNLGQRVLSTSTQAVSGQQKKPKKKNVKSLLETGQPQEQVRLQGWVRALRKHKKYTFIDVDDGSTFSRFPVVAESSQNPPDLTLYSSIVVSGILVESPKTRLMELHPTSPIRLLSSCDQVEYPLSGKIRYEPDHVRQYPHLRFKTSSFASVLRIRSAVSSAIHDFFRENNFIQIHTPILTTNDCEGGGETFSIQPSSQSLIREMKRDPKSQTDDQVFFDKKTFLSVSGQLHLEAAAGGLDKVWTMSPVFRAENAQSTRHLSEFYMVEAELAFADDIEDITSVMEQLVKYCIRKIIFDNNGDWKVACEDKTLITKLEGILKTPFTTMTLADARIALKSTDSSERGLNREEELKLVEINGGVPVFVINWPSSIKPFYMRKCVQDSNFVSAVDLLVPGVGELCGGSLRESNPEVLEANLSQMDPSLLNSLEWYLELRKFGGTPSGGFGMGLDRLLMVLLGRSNIKDVSPFPRWPHNCPM